MGCSSGLIIMNTAEILLMNAGKKLLLSLPESPHQILILLQDLEKRLQRVHQTPTKSTKYAMQPVIEALIAKQLLKHPDMDVNISVACCISEVLRIMSYKTPYTDQQMKDFFELVVITLEKLASTSSGSYNRMKKALKTLDKGKLSLKMCDLQLDGLILRLFKQFLTVADSNSPGVVTKMKQIIVMIIQKTELLSREIIDLLVTSVRKENKIASPVCWQLGRDVLKKCATQLKPHLPKKVAEEVYGPLMETIPSATRKRKFECLDGSGNMVQPLRRCRNVRKRKKKSVSADDPPMPTKYVTEAQSVEHGENLVGKRIKVWWPADKKYYQGVVKSFDCRNKRHEVLYDDGEEELLDLEQEQWELAEAPSTAELINVLEVAKEECNSLRETTESATNTIKWTKSAIKKMKLECRNRVQPVRRSKDATMPSTSVIEVSSDDDNEELVDFTAKQSELLENVSAGDVVNVQGYSVKESNGPILEAIFNKHGNIAANCLFQIASVKTCFLEVICEVVKRIESSDVSTIVSDMEDIERQVSEAHAANINVSWLQSQLETIRTQNEALKKINSLNEMKVNTILVKRAARGDLIERCEELVAAQERCVKAEECVKVLDKRADLVTDKPISTIISKRAARADLRERCKDVVFAKEQFEKAKRCVKVLDLVKEKLSKDILESQII